jgi:signal transduction histidine kinase
LAVLVVAPLATLTIVVVLESFNLAHDTSQVRREARLATATDGPSGLLEALQDERSWAAVELIGQGGQVTVGVEGYDETRRNTDEAIAGFESRLADEDPETVATFEPALASLESLAEVRQRLDDFDAPRGIENAEFGDEVFSDYGEMIVPFLDSVTEISRQISHPELRQGAGLVATASRQVEVTANLSRRTIVWSLLSPGGIDTTREITELSDMLEQFKEDARNIESNMTGAYAHSADRELLHVFTVRLSAQVGVAIATGTIDVNEFLPIVTVPNEESYNGYRDRVSDLLVQQADDLEASATERQQIYYLALVAAVLAAGLAALVSSRSITRPLRALTGQTSDMASRHLPEAVADVLETPLGDNVSVPQVRPIQVRTSDEIGELAAALNTVQDSAVELAVGQAVLRRNVADSLVNLGRRNQNLLARQLDLITELEREEADPDALANLFQLDHLATRMRRNAESLLVLAETDPPRHRNEPVRMAAVIRAALGEVEDFRRVSVRAEPTTGLMGAAASDVAHLLAELLENALMFSPPDQFVEVRGDRHPTGYTVRIIDVGVGMPLEELERANRRLAGAESFTIAPSKYLGHYVVGSLARRHGIAISLAPTPVQGVTATIEVPGHLLVQMAMPTPTPAGGLPTVPTPAVPQSAAATGPFAAPVDLRGAPHPPPSPPGPPPFPAAPAPPGSPPGPLGY